jgi:hypothetical protein
MTVSSNLTRRTERAVTSPRDSRPPSSLTPVAWVPTRELDRGEWVTAGRRLGAMGRCGQWGIGDWIQYGNTRFGERYTRAAHITGYDVQTLMNMVYVASRFDISRRRENLSWSHHEALAALGSLEQDRWLDRAAAEGLSVADLRTELRSWRRQSKGASRAGSETNGKSLLCPHCGGVVPRPRTLQAKTGT